MRPVRRCLTVFAMLCACGCMPSNFVKDSAKINNHEINPLPFFFANSIPGKNLRCPHIQIPKSQSTHFASKIVLRPLHNIIIRNGWASRPGGLLKGLMKGPKDTKHSQSCSIMLFWCIVCIKEERRLFVRVSDWVTGVGKASQKLRERNEEYWGMNMCNVNELNELCTSRTGFIQLMLTAFGQVPWFASTSRSTGRTSGRWGCFNASHFFLNPEGLCQTLWTEIRFLIQVWNRWEPWWKPKRLGGKSDLQGLKRFCWWLLDAKLRLAAAKRDGGKVQSFLS